MRHAEARSPHRAVGALLVVGAALLSSACSLRAQDAASGPPKSQHGSVSQTVAGTRIAIEYDRPSARGRRLFGDDGVVVYGALWTPGANRATTIEFSADVRVAGQPVAAGRYSVWTIPGPAQWTLILNRRWNTFHTRYPGKELDALRVRLTPERGAPMETLAYYFPVVHDYDAVLRMQWGELVLPIPIEVAR